jgi:hypothetical protein
MGFIDDARVLYSHYGPLLHLLRMCARKVICPFIYVHGLQSYLAWGFKKTAQVRAD